MKTPWLKKIDLRKILKKRDYVSHPDIKANSTYLVRCGKDWFVGSFENEIFYSELIDFPLDDPDIKGIWQVRIGR